MTDDLHHLAAAYALDALDESERRDFEAHYPTCEICAREVADFRATAAVLGKADATPAPPSLRSGVMAEIDMTRQVSPIVPAAVVDLTGRRQRRITGPRVLGAVAAALVFLSGAAAVILQSRPDPVDELVAAPDAVVTPLQGSTGTLEVVWSADRDRVLVSGSALEVTGPGLAYQLWFVLDDGSVSPAPTFTVDDDGRVEQLLDVSDLDTSGWGVSIEPIAGSLQPTSEVLYVGTI